MLTKFTVDHLECYKSEKRYCIDHRQLKVEGVQRYLFVHVLVSELRAVH